MLWVPRRDCKSTGDFARRCWRGHGQGNLIQYMFYLEQLGLYDPEASTTSNDTGQGFEVFYNSGMAKGKWFEDALSASSSCRMTISSYSFQLGSPDESQLRIPGTVTFGVASQIKFDDAGILGLSLPKPNSTGDSVLGLLVEHNLIDRPIFTTHLKRCKVDGEADNCRSGGKVTFGDEDLENCEPTVLIWIPIVSGYHWRFRVKEAKLDGEQLSGDTPVIVDSGTSYILAPFPAYRKIVDILKVGQTRAC